MRKIPETQLITNTSAVLNHFANNFSPIQITREIGNPVVLLSLKGYEAIEKLVDALEVYLPEDLNNHDQ
jgi:hypothetical protein